MNITHQYQQNELSAVVRLYVTRTVSHVDVKWVTYMKRIFVYTVVK